MNKMLENLMEQLKEQFIYLHLAKDKEGNYYLYINGEKHVIEITVNENINKYVLKTVKFCCKDYRNIKQVKSINAVITYIKRFY